MKHVGTVSSVTSKVRREFAGDTRGVAMLNRADAKSDFMNAIWRDMSDYVYQKKNETQV